MPLAFNGLFRQDYRIFLIFSGQIRWVRENPVILSNYYSDRLRSSVKLSFLYSSGTLNNALSTSSRISDTSIVTRVPSDDFVSDLTGICNASSIHINVSLWLTFATARTVNNDAIFVCIAPSNRLGAHLLITRGACISVQQRIGRRTHPPRLYPRKSCFHRR